MSRSLLTLRRDDGGFTLTETVVALFIITTVLLGLVWAQAKSVQTITVAKQREQMTALGTKYLEQMRAAPYATLKAGLSTADLTGDPNITSVSGGYRFQPTYTTGINEEIVATAGQNQAPFYPHTREEAIGPAGNQARYRISLYVTKADTYTAEVPTLWVTAITTRVSGAGKAPKPVALRTQVFSPDGCLSVTSRPFSGPCQAFFHGSAGTTQGKISITQNGDEAVPELGADAAQLLLPNVSVNASTEQTTTVDSQATTSGSRRTVAGAENRTGVKAAKATADDDPSSALLPNPPLASVSTTGTVSQASSGSFGTLNLGPATTSGGEAMAGMSSTSGLPCRDISDAYAVNAMPCGAAKLTTISESVSVTPAAIGSRSLGAFTLASVTAPSGTGATAGRAWVSRLVATQNSHCTALTASGTAGCVAAEAKRTTGAITAGGIPALSGSDTKPSGFNSAMVTVTNYTTTAASEQGIGATAKTPARSASISYWSGSGYTSKTLSTTAFTQALSPAVFTYRAGSSTIRFTLSGEVAAAAVLNQTTGSAPCETAACNTKVEVPGLRAVVHYAVDVDGARVAEFTVNTDLGSAVASTTYKAAPT